MAAPLPQPAAAPAERSRAVMSNCPDCRADLAVLRIIPGRAGIEYWTLRCTRCGGIHLDIVTPAAGAEAAQDSGDLHA